MSDEATELAKELATVVADQFALLRVIGRGGSAVVFLATDLKHDRSVALKVLRPQLATTVSHDRFLAEIRTTARLNHPHILPLFDSGEADERVFFTMPFVEGESLRERLRRETRLSIDEALRITREVASALEYAHARRVVHRDIKPENILLSTSGHAFVADFGVAYALDEARSGARTDPGFAVGTLAYMSPEEMEGERVLDGRADLYSLACVLYEMLVGSPPFLAGPSVEARKVIPSVVTRRAEVPAAVDRALRHALAKAPEQRYATMAEFTAALRHASRFEISTLGGLTIRADGRPLRGDLLTPHALACFALLARAGDRGVPRERLEALVWEGRPESEASSLMERTLAAIRSELGPADALIGERVIQLEPSLVDSDVDRFATMLREERLADAVAEYHGPFLHGFSLPQAPTFGAWVEHTAAGLAFDYAIALERLARDAEARGDYADAARWWHKLVGQDPLNGRLTAGLMRALVAAGDRSGAIEQASLYEVLIEEELELPPDRAVVAFAERLRAGWDPRDADENPSPADTLGSPRATEPIETMQAGGDGTPDTAWQVVASDSASPVSGSRDRGWRRVVLVLAAITLLLAALWLLAARRGDLPAPNDRATPARQTGAQGPPSGIGAR